MPPSKNKDIPKDSPMSDTPTLALNEQNLIWIDLEMTGLYPNTDRIIEVAVVVTDPQLSLARARRHLDRLDDVVVRGMTVTQSGEVLWPPPPVQVSAAPVAATARNAATAMAILPFLGAGQTHKEGKYKKVVNAGLYYDF